MVSLPAEPKSGGGPRVASTATGDALHAATIMTERCELASPPAPSTTISGNHLRLFARANVQDASPARQLAWRALAGELVALWTCRKAACLVRSVPSSSRRRGRVGCWKRRRDRVDPSSPAAAHAQFGPLHPSTSHIRFPHNLSGRRAAHLSIVLPACPNRQPREPVNLGRLRLGVPSRSRLCKPPPSPAATPRFHSPGCSSIDNPVRERSNQIERRNAEQKCQKLAACFMVPVSSALNGHSPQMSVARGICLACHLPDSNMATNGWRRTKQKRQIRYSAALAAALSAERRQQRDR